MRPHYNRKIQELSLKILPEQEKAKQIKEHYQKSKEQLLKAIEVELYEKKIQTEEDLSNFIEPVHEMIYPPVFFQDSLQAEQDLDRLGPLSLQQYAETEYFPQLISEHLQKRNFSQALLFVEKQPPRLGLREALDEASSIFQESIDLNNEDLIREFMQFLSKSIECGQGELLNDQNATQYFFPMLTAYLEQAVLEKKFSFLNGFCDGIRTSLFLRAFWLKRFDRHSCITVASSKNFGGVMSKKKAQEFYSAIDGIADKEAFLESVREGFLEIEDPRAKDNQSYRLVDLLIIIRLLA